MFEITWQVSTSKVVCTERKESLSVPLNYTVLKKNEQLKMHKDEDLDCKMLSVIMRHFKKYLEIFFFWNLPPSLARF